MATQTDFPKLLDELGVEDDLKKELLELHGKKDRTPEETNKYKELLVSLRDELVDEYADAVHEDQIIRDTEAGMAEVDEQFQSDLAVTHHLAEAEDEIAKKKEESDQIDQAKRDIEEA